MTGHRIIKNLTKRGNTVLGIGAYSAALSASNGVDAIKVGTNIDDPWIDFKQLVVDELTTNAHLPNIKSFYSDSNSEFYVCVMERLQPAPHNSEYTEIIDACSNYVSGSVTKKDFISLVPKNSSIVPSRKELLAALNLIKKYTTHICGDDFNDDSEDRMLDMHHGNFMLRDEVLVITDPWCNVCMDDVADLTIWADEQHIDY